MIQSKSDHYYDHVTKTMAAEFERGVDDGVLRPGLDYTAIAQRCIAMCDGLQLQWEISGGTFDLVGQMRAYLELLAPTMLSSGERINLDQRLSE